MACKVGYIHLEAGAIGTEYSATGIGFTPDAVFFRWTGRDPVVDSGPTRQYINAGFGYMLTNGERGCVGEGVQDNADPYAARAGMWNDTCIVAVNNAGGTVGKFDFLSMDSDGFTVRVDEQLTSGHMTVIYTAISGKTFKAIEFQEPAGVGNQAYVGAGFEPTFVMILGQGVSTYNTMETNCRISIGASVGPDADNNAVFSKFEAHNAGTADTGTYCRRTECLAVMSNATSVSRRAILASLDADGFTLNWVEAPNAGSRFLAVVSDGRWYVNNDNAKAAGTIDLSGFTWSPEAALFVSATREESTQDVGQPVSVGTTKGNFSFGMGTGPTERHCLLTRYTYDAFGGASRTVWLHEFDEVFCAVNDAGAPATQVLMDINIPFTTDLIQLIMDDGDAYGSFFFYVAIGPPLTVFRESLVMYDHNTYQSRKAGRLIIRNAQGREVRPEQVETDNWIFSGGAGFPTPDKREFLLEDKNVFYCESLSVGEGRLDVQTDREGFFESIMKKLGRG